MITIKFGKYRGVDVEKIPATYLLWLDANVRDLDYEIKNYICHNYEELKKKAANCVIKGEL